MYANHQTWAQHEEQKKNVREKYFEDKMHEQWRRADNERDAKNAKRAQRWTEAKDINNNLAA